MKRVWATSLLVIASLGVGCAQDGDPLDAGPDLKPDLGVVFDSGALDSGARTDLGSADLGTPDLSLPDAGMLEGELSGTSLQDVSISWSEPLELCDLWREGPELDAAALRKTRLILWPKAQGGLEPAQLQTAGLQRVMVQKGWTPELQRHLSEVPMAVTAWSTSGPADRTRLTAQIQHQIEGQGVLVQDILVERTQGDAAPVQVTGETFSEVSFVWRGADGSEVFLEACGGPAYLETAVKVLAAYNDERWISLERVERTYDADAGSAPVYPIAAFISGSGQPFAEPISTSGFWTQTYAAAHHNFNEHAWIEPRKEPRWYQLIFGPFERGEPVTYPPLIIERIELQGVNNVGSSAGALVVEELELMTGQKLSATLPVGVGWTRVDDVALLRELACNNPEVRAVDVYEVDGGYLFQIGRCDGVPALVVPVRFPAAPQLVGARIRGVSMVPGGFEVTQDEFQVRFTEMAQDSFQVVVSRMGSVVLDGFGFGRELVESAEVLDDVTAAQSDDGEVWMRMVRRLVGQGGGNSGLYAPVVFELGFGGTTHRVEALPAMLYTNTHHNHDDSLVADSGDVRLFWEVRDFGATAAVRAERISDGEVLLGETIVRSL